MGADDMSLPLLSFLAVGVVAGCYAWRRSLRPNFPPGPPGLPILGNVFDTPITEPWRAYKTLGENYGDIIHLRVLTQDMIILNSYEAIKDLLEHRSQNYSDRPHIPGNDLVDFGWGTGFLPYGEEWKTHRKIFQYALRSERMPLYQSMQLMKICQLLKNMCDTPADYERHFRSFSTAISMAATYDYHPAPRDDPMVNNLKILAGVGVSLLGPAHSLLFAAFPFLMYVPSWFPGATWQRTADKGRKVVNWWLTAPVQHVQDKMAEGPIAPCLVGDALSRIDEKRTDAENAIRLIKGAAASSLLGASDTTDSTLQVFVLAMVLNPDAQRRAQAEIQAVVGSERLPDFSDRPNMPYIEAVYRETLRWHPALPFALVRSAVNDDIYRGYSFPKGVTIIPNLWQVHIPFRYPDPFTFNPNRFFDDNGNLNDDTVSFAYGFGRRVCVGRALAENSVWAAIVNLLAVFSFEAPLDETGRPVKIEPRFTTGLTSHPESFPVQITMRMDPQKFTSLLGTENDVDELATNG
ncbi:cytochrome P450 [Boletus edulis BED1]|uniref:Cytochrome P450 n=1 Tax=Boletus edulis BED1 TaxID=1328754 RepID=A0AAD4GFB1_BOLED|nr:cytochrome P450 [Boletus edulis BED1]